MLSAQSRVVSFSRRMQRSFSGVNRTVERMNRTLNRGLRVVGGAAIAGIGFAAVTATRQFIEFDQAITSAGAKFKDLDTTAADYQDRLKELGNTARDVAKITEFTATDTAGALEKMAMAGMTSSQSMALLQGTTNLATAANTDLTTAVDIATDSMGAFGLATDDVAQAEKNLTLISDVMAKTTTTSNTSLLDMFESVKAGAASFTAAGQSVETFSALTGIMANAGIKGSMAGTSLRNMALRLADPTAEAAKVLGELGVVVADEQGNFRDFMDVLADMETGLSGMGTAQRTAALSTVFGARTVTGINTVLAAGVSNVRDYRAELDKAGGSAVQMAEAMRNSIGNRINVLKSGLTELGFQFVEAFEIQGRNALDLLIEKVQSFDVQPIVDGMVRFVDFIKQAIPIVQDLGPTVLIIAAGIKSWAIAQKLLNVALNASPLGLFVTSVVALIAIMEVLERKFGIGEMVAEAGGAPYSREFEEGRRERLAERREAGEQTLYTRGVFADDPETMLRFQRITEESRVRNDVFLNAPKGFTMTGLPGTAPSTAVQLGGQ